MDFDATNTESADMAGPAAVVALKSLDLAKSRFVGLNPAVRRRLALCMLADTVEALSRVVNRVTVVTSTPALAAMVGAPELEVLADPGPDLNSAFKLGAEHLSRQGFSPVLATVGDLPGLTSTAVRQILDHCRAPGRYFVRDHHQSGTTMLIAIEEPLRPLFEGGSAHRHRESGAAEIAAPEAARTDVDSADDLAYAATAFELGARTKAMLDGPHLARHDVATVCEVDRDRATAYAISTGGHRIAIPTAVVDEMIINLAVGQRIHVQRSGMQVLSAWI